MDSAYHGGTTREKRTGTARPGKRKGPVLAPREKRRLLQLGVCVALFLGVFFAKGIFPGKLDALRTGLSQVLCSDADFAAAFADLGYSLSAGEPAEALAGAWDDLVLARARQPVTENGGGAALYRQTLKTLSEGGDPLAALVVKDGQTGAAQGEKTIASAIVPTPMTTPTPAPTPAPDVIRMDYTGPALPDNTTMDQYNLGLDKAVTPAMGRLTSEFGWREHPIEGGEKFHYGVDLAMAMDTPVGAFADGTVEYIGQSQFYGNYVRILHANNVTSFYCHCDKLLVQKGQTVTAGETVALSGSTGESTGPHLHLELTRNGVRLNPIYYIETAG